MTTSTVEGSSRSLLQSALYTPSQKLTRSDVHFPLTTPRKRIPSIPLLTHANTEDGHSGAGLTLIPDVVSPTRRLSELQLQYTPDPVVRSTEHNSDHSMATSSSLIDLPAEIWGRILDHIFGDMQSVNSISTSTSVSHTMRHPRRKAVSELALVCSDWRELVQERIYRHIKVKGTKHGLEEAQIWFTIHPYLANHVRHIEYWVPVWGDKAAALERVNRHQRHDLGHDFQDDSLMTAHDFPGFNFKLSTYSATLADIFEHTRYLFPEARIFTLEGGHCKNSNMIKHFPQNLFSAHLNQQLVSLPGIRNFVMRGAWNIMRRYEDWTAIEAALPNVEEWHCGYAKPRWEAYLTINKILLKMPMTLRHVDISLDGMYSKDDGILGSSTYAFGFHLCEQLGRMAPHLESLMYTGKICECFWTSAFDEVRKHKGLSSKLKSLEVVLKNCCRQRVTNVHAETGETIIEEVGGIMADGAGITNLVFIRAFERFVLGAVESLAIISSTNNIRIRYVDLDSPCALLNPYWHLRGSTVLGVWNEEIVERLSETRPGVSYEELGDGIGGPNSVGNSKKEDDVFDWSRSTNGSTTAGAGTGANTHSHSTGISALFPKIKPRSIKTSSYRTIMEGRST